MKTLITGLLVLGLTTLVYSQNQNGGVASVNLAEVDVTPLNLTYLNKVQDDTTPESVKVLESVASRYDVTESPVYNGNFEAYEVVFKESDGKIIATYDAKGKIISSHERFNDVLLPIVVRNSILTDHPGWMIHKDTYLVSYYFEGQVKKVYKVQLRKDSKRKTVKMDIKGNTI